MVHIVLDPDIVKKVLSTSNIELESGVEEILKKQLRKELEDIFRVLDPGFPGKVSTNELRRVLKLKGYKICY